MATDHLRTYLLAALQQGEHRGGSLSRWSWLLIVGGVLYQLAFIFQGLDFTDTGFHLTAYQQIFDHPESVHYSFMFWLSDIVGGSVMKLFPSGGLLLNRFLAVVVHSFIFWIYYRVLLSIATRDMSVVVVFLSALFFQYYGFETLNYDSFSIAGFSVAVYFLLCALDQKSDLRLFLGALVLGVIVYFRITNLAGICFVPLTLWFIYREWTIDIRSLINKVIILIAGYVLGHLLVLLLMMSLGHMDLFISNLKFTSEMSADGDSSHGMIPVMISYLKGWIKIGLAAVLCGLLVATGYRWRAVLKVKYAHIVLLPFLLGLIVLLILYPLETWSKVRYIYYGAILLNTGLLVYLGGEQTRRIAMFGFLMFLIFPLGSDSGVEKLYFASGLSGGLLFLTFHGLLIDGFGSIVKRYLLVAFVASCLIFGYSQTYFDLGGRLQKTYTTDHPHLQYIYTTQERSRSVDEVVETLRKYVNREEYLLAFSDIPMINYLTESVPFIGTSWPKLYYASNIFGNELDRATELNGHPLIVLHKMEMRSDWPQHPNPDYLNLENDANRLPDHYRIMYEYLDKWEYEKVWENEVFMIYKNDKRK